VSNQQEFWKLSFYKKACVGVGVCVCGAYLWQFLPEPMYPELEFHFTAPEQKVEKNWFLPLCASQTFVRRIDLISSHLILINEKSFLLVLGRKNNL